MHTGTNKLELGRKKSQYYDIPASTTGPGDYKNSPRKTGLFPEKYPTAREVIAAFVEDGCHGCVV